MKIFDELQWRGLVFQVSDEEKLSDILTNQSIGIYCGFDPTASSMHIGNLVALITLKRLQDAGHQPIIIIGGATGMIGDPSGKKEERKLLSQEEVEKNRQSMEKQAAKFFPSQLENKVMVLNNYDWVSKLTIIDFLRDIGKQIGVNYLLAKESVSTRLETGISYTEFTYPMIQAYDYYYLYQHHHCRLQIGGSDQWGNMTTGLELIRKSGEKDPAFVFTIPLITKSDGTKFGKTESGTIWLDGQRTSPYMFYQFWLNVADADVISYLKLFTFLDKQTIDTLEQSLQKNPHLREAQRVLAKELTLFVHGEEGIKQANRITDALFKGEINDLTKNDMESLVAGVETVYIHKNDYPLVDLFVETNLISSKRQAREDIQNGAMSINGRKETDVNYQIQPQDWLYGKYLFVRKGKKTYTLYVLSHK